MPGGQSAVATARWAVSAGQTLRMRPAVKRWLARHESQVAGVGNWSVAMPLPWCVVIGPPARFLHDWTAWGTWLH